MPRRRRNPKDTRRHSPQTNRRPQNSWRETEEGHSALTERVKKGAYHDRQSKTKVDTASFDPDRLW